MGEIAIVIAESQAELSLRFESLAFVGGHLPPPPPKKSTEFGPRRLCDRCVAIRIARLAFVGVVFVPTCHVVELRNGLRDLIAFAER